MDRFSKVMMVIIAILLALNFIKSEPALGSQSNGKISAVSNSICWVLIDNKLYRVREHQEGTNILTDKLLTVTASTTLR
jgi:hypothetical protein